ncbi:MAG: SpoIIE family protein phosphatase [Planctomycetia bacterium]|nr:SpoIIE family protein phosphatase [Planctomycetia bacterium]
MMSDLSDIKKVIDILGKVSSVVISEPNMDRLLTRVLQVLANEIEIIFGDFTLRQGDLYHLKSAYGLNPEEIERGVFSPGEGITGTVGLTGEPYLVEDVLCEPAFLNKIQHPSLSRHNAFLCVPVKRMEKTVGTLSVVRPTLSRAELELEMQILQIVGNLTAEAIAVFYEEQKYRASKEKEDKFLFEIGLANQVQQAFLPSKYPEVEGYEFYHYYQPAQHLGGDFFDYIPVYGDRLALVLADVSGKGLSAALLTVKLSAVLRNIFGKYRNLKTTVEKTNQEFCGLHSNGRFITMELGLLDAKTHDVQLTNAGHLFPFLRRADGKVEILGIGSQCFPIGLFRDYPFREFSVHIEPGEKLIILSDGITEASNFKGELFQKDRVIQSLSACKGNSAKEIGENLIKNVLDFVGSFRQTDDQCIMVFGRK